MSAAAAPHHTPPGTGSRARRRLRAKGARCAGDAFRTLYRDHAGALLAYAECHACDRTAAEDALQETFRRAWHDLPPLLADDRPAGPWLLQVLRRVLDEAAEASRGRRVRLVEDTLPVQKPGAGHEAAFAQQLLAEAMERLAPPHREMLVDTYFRDLPPAHLAAAAGLPVGVVRSRLHQALTALGQQLTDTMSAAHPQAAAVPPDAPPTTTDPRPETHVAPRDRWSW
ncbi:MAG: polymerase, sigma-24 subunit, subfamily [Blastococcus sp.]|nr:polymerase, sigma-24 subunit, subfamily [Blastococcus sp.]